VIGNFTGLPEDLSADSPHRNYAMTFRCRARRTGTALAPARSRREGALSASISTGRTRSFLRRGSATPTTLPSTPTANCSGSTPTWNGIGERRGIGPCACSTRSAQGDTGFREGSAKWPEYYADSIPAAVNIGIGCPTGVLFGYGAKYPAKYQKAYYILDWSYGRIIAVHLQAGGASYTGSWENFLAPKSLHASAGKDAAQSDGCRHWR